MSWSLNRRNRRRLAAGNQAKRSKFVPRLTALESRDTPTAFTPGDIVVVREASNTLNSALPGGTFANGGNAPVYLDEYTPDGHTLVQSVQLPYTAGVGMAGNQAFTFDPSNGTGCGQLNLSFDSSVLTLAGNDAIPGTVDADAKAAYRVIAQVGIDPAATGGINTTQAGLFGNTDDARAVVEANPNTIYVANHANSGGTDGGTRYINGLTTTPNDGVQTSQNTNTRGITIGFDGRLYWTTGGPTGVYTQGPALPTSAQTDSLVVANTSSGEKLDGLFMADMNGNGILDQGDRVYYTGSTATGLDASVYDPNNTTGLPHASGSSWTTPISLGNPTGSNVIGLTAQVASPTHVVLFISTYGGTTSQILRYDDIGTNPTPGGGFTSILSTTSAGGSGYRGVSFAPMSSTAIGLNTSTTATTPGSTVTFTANVSNASNSMVGQTISFIDNSNQVLGTATVQSNGVATYSTTSLPLGANSVKAYFAGSYSPEVAMGMSNYVSVQVTGTTPSTTSPISSPNPSTFNQTVTFTAQVTGSSGTPTGTVTFTSDSNNVLGTVTVGVNGYATLSISSLAVGSHIVNAAYSGDATYQPSNGTMVMAQNVHAGATVAVTSSAPNTTAGSAVTFTATVSGNGVDAAPTGSVTFYSDGVAIGTGAVPLTGNQAQLPISNLSAGSHMITATYSGDTTYGQVTSPQFLQNMKQAFAQGDLLVARLGDSSSFLSSSAAQIYIDEYTPTGTFVQSVAMPNVDSGTSHMLTLSGSSPNSGGLAVSADGHSVSLVGIDAAPGTVVVTSQSPATTPRTVARLTADSSLDTSTTVTIPSGQGFGSVVSAVSNDGNEFWIGGDGSTVDSGLRYATLGSSGTPAAVGPTDSSTRVGYIYNGQLYASTGNNATPIVQVGTGLPTSQTTFTGLPNLSVTQNGINDPEQFLFFNHTGTPGAAPDLLYIADLQQGILKFAYGFDTITQTNDWQFVGDKRDFQGGMTGLTGFRDPTTGTITLYATGSRYSQGAFATNLVKVVDSNAGDPVNWNTNFPSGNPAEIATVYAKGEAFRGVAFVPTPAPPTVAFVEVNGGQQQTSSVTTLKVTFSSQVTLGSGAFTLTRVGTYGGAAGDGATLQSSDGTISVSTSVNGSGQTVATLTFSGANTVSGSGSLNDGNWTLTVNHAAVNNLGTPMAADYTQSNIKRLFGDFDGSGTVNAFDYGHFRQAYGSSSTDAAYLAFFDYDASTAINAFDYGQFRLRLGLSM
jgi:hypothetical protein